MVAAGRDFAGRGLDEIAAGAHPDFAREADVVVSLQLAGFENHFQMRVAARFLHRGDFVEDSVVIAGQKNAAIDHHVDLIRAVARRAAHFFELQIERHQTGRKRGRDRGDFHAGIAEKFLRDLHQIWINANRRAGRHLVARIDRLHRLAAEKGDFAGRVFSFQRRQVHHRDRELEAGEFGRSLDAALGERGRALFDHHLIDGRDFPAIAQGVVAVIAWPAEFSNAARLTKFEPRVSMPRR